MKPILFNTDMVWSIIEGQKTVTRRVVKPQPQPPCELRKVTEGRYAGEIHLYSDKPLLDAPNHSPWGVQFVPPFQSGDILYVRETWRVWRAHRYDANADIIFKAGGAGVRICFANGGTDSIDRDDYDRFIEKWYPNRKWHPSIHMPSEVARLFLKVKAVRVERLNEITVDGILNEGVGHWIEPPPICTKDGPSEEERAKYAALPKKKQEAYIQTLARHTYMGWCDYADKLFREWAKVWDSPIKPADLNNYGWEANPWVWVIEFERCKKPEVV